MVAVTATTAAMAETAELSKRAKTAKMGETAKMVKTAKTGLGWAKSNNPLALLKNKGQGRAGSNLYDFTPERQFNLLVHMLHLIILYHIL